MALVSECVENDLPGIRFVPPQGTYLAWMDASGLGLSAEEIQSRLVNRGRVGIMSGAAYGDARCLRMNVACPRAKLEEGLSRMRKGLGL
jgi:cystathionine beta-lyase